MTDLVAVELKVRIETEWVYPLKVSPEQAAQIRSGDMSDRELAKIAEDQFNARYWLDEADTVDAVGDGNFEVLDDDGVPTSSEQ